MLLSAIDAVLSPAPDPARVSWLREHEYAHRGVHDERVPENSPAAFAEAIRRGMGIECDVQKSRDGRAMVFHDWELDRLTATSGAVSARDASECQTIALRGSSDCIATLDCVLAQVAGQVPLLIEIKSRLDRSPVPVCLAVHRAIEGYRGMFAVMSFDPRVPKWFRRYAPGVLRGLVITDEDSRGPWGRVSRRVALWHAKPDFIACDVRDLPNHFAASQRNRGLPLLTWTVCSIALRDRARQYADAPIAEGAGLA